MVFQHQVHNLLNDRSNATACQFSVANDKINDLFEEASDFALEFARHTANIKDLESGMLEVWDQLEVDLSDRGDYHHGGEF